MIGDPRLTARLLLTGLFAAFAGCATDRASSIGHYGTSATVSPVQISNARRGEQETPDLATFKPAASSSTIEPISFTTEVEIPPASNPVDGQSRLPPAQANFSGMAVDLASSLQLVCGQNPNLMFARERINEAYAQQARAEALWLPSIRAGANWNKHEGRIQDVAGNVFNTSRGAYFMGFGANNVGAASPTIPGVFASFHLADAIHQPKIAEHATVSRQYSATIAEQDLVLQTATAYLELLRSNQELAIARDIEQYAIKLSDLTRAYAETGQGLAADYDRASAELAVRRNDVVRAEESVQVASARLAQLLHVDPTLELLPTETTVAPLSLVGHERTIQELVAEGLSHRAEICEQRQLVEEACERLKREQHAPWLPSILLGVSYGGFGGGKGDDFRQIGNRLDADAIAYWEIRNFGLGEKAARAEANSRVNQARWREIATLDRIAREVAEAQMQVTARHRQVPVAEEGVQAAISSFERNSERIRNAQGLPLETLQSLQALAQARREYLRAVNDYNVAQFQLQRALGWSPIGQ